VQSFSGALYAHSVDVSQLKHHAHLLSPSTVVATVAETVGGDVQQLVDRWNQLVGETNDREVIRTASLSASCTIVDVSCNNNNNNNNNDRLTAFDPGQPG